MSDKLTPEEALADNADLVAAARDRSIVILDFDEAQRVIVELWDALAASQERVRELEQEVEDERQEYTSLAEHHTAVDMALAALQERVREVGADLAWVLERSPQMASDLRLYKGWPAGWGTGRLGAAGGGASMKRVAHWSTLGIIICTGREPGPRQRAVWGRMRVTCKKCREALGLPVVHRRRAMPEPPGEEGT